MQGVFAVLNVDKLTSNFIDKFASLYTRPSNQADDRSKKQSMQHIAKRAKLSACTCSHLQLRQSHIGATPIPLPSNAAITFTVAPNTSPAARYSSNPHLRNSRILTVQGPHGSLALPLAEFIRFDTPEQKQATVSVKDTSAKIQRATWGLTRSLIANAVKGVSEQHTLPINLIGVGYRATLEDGGKRLAFKLGFPLPIVYDLPAGVSCTVSSPTNIVLQGVDKAVLSQFAAKVRNHRKPEPYNGKVCRCPTSLASRY